MIFASFHMFSPTHSFYLLISYSQEKENFNSPPDASNNSATVTLGQPTSIKLEVSDNENNQLQMTIVDQPQFGTLSEMNATTNTVTYTPNSDAIPGSDTFTYTVNDGTVDSQPATVTITLEGLPNQPPTVQAGNATIIQGTSKDIKLNATDSDADDTLQFSIVNEPQNGQLGEINQENGTVSYTPNEGFTGSDTFTYLVNDGTVDSSPATVTVNVQAIFRPQFQMQQEMKDSDNDGIEDQIDVEPNKKSIEFSDNSRTTYGSILDYGNQTINIRQVDEHGIMIISQSNTGDYPALMNICNQYEYYIETNDSIRFECEPTNSTSLSNGGAKIE